MTAAGQKRLSEALLSMGRAFFELGEAIERLNEPEPDNIAMRNMEREVVGKPVKHANGARR